MSKTCLKLVIACTAAGCAANPATGIGANGQPLRVRYSSGTGTYVSNDVVGTDVHRDSQGNEVGSTDHYQPVEHSYRWNDLEYFQGRESLDEQDFFRIAGDEEAVDKIESIRSRASLQQKIGAPLMVVGLAAALVLTTIGAQNSNGTLTTAGYLGGGLVGTAGLLTFYLGRKNMVNRHHMPNARADQNADVIEDCEENQCRSQRGGRGR